MADKTPDQLTSATTAADTDLLMVYPAGGPLKKYTFASFLTQVTAGLGSAFLIVSNNLSDLASATAARANLGLGTAATLASSALFQTANNLSEVSNAATARANLGAAASASPTITGGMSVSGTTKLTPLAVAAADVDFSVQEVQTKAISTNTALTFSGLTSGKAQGILLVVTISGGATLTFPTGTETAGGAVLSLGNGKHYLGLITENGSTVAAKVLIRNALGLA